MLAWDDGETAVVLIERAGADQADLTETAKQIAAADLAALYSPDWPDALEG